MLRTTTAPSRIAPAALVALLVAALPAAAPAAAPKLSIAQQAGPGTRFTVTAKGVKRKSEYGLTLKVGSSPPVDVVGFSNAVPARSSTIKLAPPVPQLGGNRVSQYVLTSAPAGATSVSATLKLTLKVYGKRGITFKPVASRTVTLSIVRPTITVGRAVVFGGKLAIEDVNLANMPGGPFRLVARPASGGACPDGTPRVRLLSDTTSGPAYSGSVALIAPPCLASAFVVEVVADEGGLPGVADTTRPAFATSAPVTPAAVP